MQQLSLFLFCLHFHLDHQPTLDQIADGIVLVTTALDAVSACDVAELLAMVLEG